MSRRPNPAENRTEQNRATLKSLVKLESNKSCADCKRNKHPRWASWNLGIFVCIRCSGIHRGMGTHISRVKSVDLDSWTDEQMQSMLRWGNARANKYWEAKLAPGHVPSESKIENFIRTKYESKRWVMEGPMPDPATLDTGGDDDVPLNLVQEKAKLERSSSLKAAGASQAAKPPPRPTQNIDLFGDEPTPAPPRPNTTEPPVRAVPPKAEAPKQSKPADSLLGLDFFGGGPAAPPARPASTTGASNSSNAPSRPDLKQSILSLYAAKPAAPPQPQPQHSPSASFGMQTSPAQSPPPQQSGFGGFNDAFSSLSFGSPTAQQPPKPSPFADLMSSAKSPPAPTHTTTSSTSGFGGGGGFFDLGSKPATTPSAAPKPPQSQQRTMSSTSGFGDFLSSTSPVTTAPAAQPTSSFGNDLFDLSAPAPQAAAPAPPAAPVASSVNSAFNLSAPKPAPTQPVPQAAHPGNFSTLNNTISNDNPWGSTDAWSSAAPAKSPAATKTDFGWSAGNAGTAKPAAPPQVAAEEDFGGWSSAAPAAAPASNTSTQPPKPVGGFNAGGDDLFGNVWG